MRKSFGLFFVLLAACGGSTTGPDPDTNASFTASIDGQAWAADANTLQISSSIAVPGTLIISGTQVASAQNYTSMVLTLGYIGATGTYPLGVNQVSTAGGGATVSVQAESVFNIWNTGFSGAAGTVTITSLAVNRITGTFQFSAPPQQGSGSPGTKLVTSGAFDVPIGSGFTIPPFYNKGSRISATLDGTAWNGATVVALGLNGSFSGGGTSDSYNITLTTLQAVTSGGTYQLVTGIQLSVSNGSISWGGPGSTGSVTVSTIGNGRVMGTFTGTLPRLGGGAALTVANGTFDLRIDPI